MPLLHAIFDAMRDVTLDCRQPFMRHVTLYVIYLRFIYFIESERLLRVPCQLTLRRCAAVCRLFHY